MTLYVLWLLQTWTRVLKWLFVSPHEELATCRLPLCFDPMNPDVRLENVWGTVNLKHFQSVHSKFSCFRRHFRPDIEMTLEKELDIQTCVFKSVGWGDGLFYRKIIYKRRILEKYKLQESMSFWTFQVDHVMSLLFIVDVVTSFSALFFVARSIVKTSSQTGGKYSGHN